MGSMSRRAKRNDADGLSSWSRRRILSWSLFGLAGLVVVQHLIAHGGFQPLPMSMGWQDLIVGYPMAIFLAIMGGITLDPNPRI